MRYITFTPETETQPRVGAILDNKLVVDLTEKANLPFSMSMFLRGGEEFSDRAAEAATVNNAEYELGSIHLKTPLLRPNTLRDFYAFERHVATATANRGRKVPEEWYQIPVFYFSNPHAVFGPMDGIRMPKYTLALDFELEVACIIGKEGKDIHPEEANDYIFGYTIFNDWSARDVQKQEMKVGLGPAKGKDFASSFGPYIITADELEDRADGRPGVFDLKMTARLNDEEISLGNWNELHYSFGEMIARASDGVALEPGDIIGSGTVGTGCLLELTKGQGPWLKKGDEVTLAIERLGKLRNKII